MSLCPTSSALQVPAASLQPVHLTSAEKGSPQTSGPAVETFLAEVQTYHMCPYRQLKDASAQAAGVVFRKRRWDVP